MSELSNTTRRRIVDAYRDEVLMRDICLRFAIGHDTLRKILAEEGVEDRGSIRSIYEWRPRQAKQARA